MSWKWKNSRENRQFYEQLVSDELDRLYRTAWRLTGSTVEAEDLTQEVFLKAWRSIDKLRRVAAVRPWLFRVLRTTWIDKLRKSGRRPQLVALDEPPEEVAPESVPILQPSSERSVWNEHFDEEVLAAMDKLPDAEREVLVYVTFGEMTYKEIAEALDCPIGTVMSRLHRARGRLQKGLVDYATRRGIIRKEDQGRAEA